MVLERLASVLVLAVDVAEQFHRLDVGVAVDDPAGQGRAGVRKLLGTEPDARHEEAERRDIGADPHRQGKREPPIHSDENHQRAHREHGDEPERVDDLHHKVGEARRGLHDVRGDAAGEIVGEIGD